MRIVNAADPFSINDLGCGYGALLDYLDARGFKTDYTGIDVSPEMVRAAALRFEGRANADFICAARIDREADYSVASGIFNVRLKSLDTEWCAHIEATLYITIGSRCVVGAGALLLGDADADGVYIGTKTERRPVPSTELRKI